MKRVGGLDFNVDGRALLRKVIIRYSGGFIKARIYDPPRLNTLSLIKRVEKQRFYIRTTGKLRFIWTYQHLKPVKITFNNQIISKITAHLVLDAYMKS